MRLHPFFRRIPAALSGLVALWLMGSPAPAGAQAMPRPHLDWRTLRTEHFDVHYPTELAEWTRDVVSRIEAVHERVSALVGNAPGGRITVVVEDPLNVSNGSAWPTVDRASLYLWPIPPEPRTTIEHFRSWPELLVVHEYAHLAHLTRPTRNPRRRFLLSLAPVALSPMVTKSPRWVIEGYATLVEGMLTGSGRPRGVSRPTVLRQWALEGKLPTYGELNGTREFLQGSMAYLVGSAYLEWLAEQRGDSSLVHLWRRMTARQNRSFNDAFAGVFGGQPADLYDRFRVDLTERALQARDTLAAAGLVVGDTVQALTWHTGDPAVSPDGEHIAIPLRSRTEPTRVVVWKTVEEPDTAEEAARRRRLERDPEDVPAIQWRPREKKPVATLHAVAGRGYSSPRFFPNGEEVLVTRSVPLQDGAERPDLFVWNWKTGDVRRITSGAAVRHGDPSPDGATAAAVRCLNGRCDLVRVHLASGVIATLAPGSIHRAFYRPRWAPDGRSVVAAMQQNGRWHLVRVDARGGEPQILGPADSASRYDGVWTPAGELIAVSEAGGVANLVRVSPETGEERALTRVTGAAYAPAPHPDGSIYFLHLAPSGLALHRIHPDSVQPGPTVALSPELAPAAPRPSTAAVDTFPRAELPTDRAYGLGPRQFRWLPGLSTGGEGTGGTLAISSTDPVGRFTTLLQGSHGEKGTWRGGGLGVAYRGVPPVLGADLFWTEHAPSRQPGAVVADLDARYAGGALTMGRSWATSTGSRALRAGASSGILENPRSDGGRHLGFVEGAWRTRRTSGERFLAAEVGLHGAAGRTAGASWSRGIARLELAAGGRQSGLRVEASYGVTGLDAPLWERFAVGGSPVTLFDRALLSQRLTLPGLPTGVLTGARMLTGRATLRVGGIAPFLWVANPEASRDGWYRVLGMESTQEVPPIPLIGIPSVQLTSGVLYPLDEPFRKKLRAYLLLGFRP